MALKMLAKAASKWLLGKDFSQWITAMYSDPYFVGFLPILHL